MISSIFLCVGLFNIINDGVSSSEVTYNYTVYTDQVLRNISTPFYGFTFDFWKNEDSGGKWYPNASILTLNLSDENLIELTKHLSPAILRIGGSPQDSVVYNMSGECSQDYGLPGYSCSQETNSKYYGCITKERWSEINEFARKTNITLVFGLSACYGREANNKAMNFSNIINLIKYTNTLNDNASNLFAFEFGNELQLHIDSNTYANDFYTLYQIIRNTSINSNLKLIGNDDFSPSYTSSFLSNLNTTINNDDGNGNKYTISDVLYRLTYHHYPNCGYPGGDNKTVFDLTCLESIHSSAQEYSNMASKYSGIIAWMGEGSEHSGGGTPNVSDTMIDNFYYVYQLGNVLRYGVYGTIRSDLTGGDYELIDHLTFKPNPDYWILYIWNQLIGDKLYESNLNPANSNVRVFAYALKGDDSGASFVLTAINFDMKNSARINVHFETSTDNNGLITLKKNGVEYDCEAYYIKPKGNSIQTRMIYVNDVLMEYENGVFPQITSVSANADSIELDAARLGFFVFKPSTNGV